MSGFNNPVVGGGGDLVRERIRSPDYAAGVTGWSINQDGSAEFNEVTVRGTVEAGTGGDGITIVPSPVPGIFFDTSNTDEVAGANLGYDGTGQDADRWFVQGPDFGQGGDAVIFDPDPTNQTLTIQFNDFFQIFHASTFQQISMDGSQININTDVALISAGTQIKRGSLTAPTLINSWANFGAGFQTAAYVELPDHFGELVGVVKDGTVPSTIFVVPAALRPAATQGPFSCACNAGLHAQIVVDTSGNVTMQNADPGVTWVSLAGCRWPISGF